MIQTIYENQTHKKLTRAKDISHEWRKINIAFLHRGVISFSITQVESYFSIQVDLEHSGDTAGITEGSAGRHENTRISLLINALQGLPMLHIHWFTILVQNLIATHSLTS